MEGEEIGKEERKGKHERERKGTGNSTNWKVEKEREEVGNERGRKWHGEMRTKEEIRKKKKVWRRQRCKQKLTN